MSNVAGQKVTLVVEDLPFIAGAIGVGSPNVMIYTGDYTFPPNADNIIAFSDKPTLGVAGSEAFRLCVFEIPSMLPNMNGIG